MRASGRFPRCTFVPTLNLRRCHTVRLSRPGYSAIGDKRSELRREVSFALLDRNDPSNEMAAVSDVDDRALPDLGKIPAQVRP